MQIVVGSQNPTQWSHPSHPGSLWSLAILCGPLWCFPGPLRSLAVFIVTPKTDPKTNPNPNTNPNPTLILTLFSCFMLFSSTVL